MLLLAITLAIASTCTPNSELDDRKADACHLTGGRPDVAVFAHCTTKRGSCRWSGVYRGCAR